MFRVLEVKVAYIEQVRKIDERQELHTLECAHTGMCTSWICNFCTCFGPLAL